MPAVIGEQCPEPGSFGRTGMTIAPVLPHPGLSSPQCREASQVPAETTKSPVAFSKILEEAASDESGQPAALHTQNQPGAQRLSVGWGGGQENRGSPGSIALPLWLQRPHPLVGPVGSVTPSCVCYIKTG